MKKVLKEKGIYILAFFVPWIVVIINSMFRNVWPLGEGSILTGDCREQYYQLCVELWSKVHSGGSVLFSWNAGGGFDFLLNMFYYLISPFTLIILAVQKNSISDVLQFVIVLKWSFMYVSMLYYFMHTEFNKITSNKKIISFVCASVYALSNCIIYRLNLFNWNDVLILFPILLLLLEKMVRDGSWKKYSVVLWLAILCNFYTAYQVCLFLILWFVLCVDKSTENKLKKVLIFVGSSTMSAISACIVILPSIMNAYNRSSMSEENIKLFRTSYIGKWIVSIWGLFSKMFIFDNNISNSLTFKPVAYFSIGALVLAAIYIGTKSKIKVKLLVILAIMTLSILSGTLSYVWHGFSIPHGHYHRILYIFVFVFAFIAMDLYNNVDQASKKKSYISVACVGVLLVGAFLHITEFADFYGYFISFMLFVFYIILVVLYWKKSISNNIFVVVFCSLIFAELFANSLFVFREYANDSIKEEYNIEDSKKLTDDAKLNAGERVSVINKSDNEGLLLDMPVQNMFLSYCFGDYVRMSRALGMPYDDDALYSLYGASPLINLMHNIRYAIANSNLCVAGMTDIKTNGEYTLFENDNIAGLGYMVNDKAEEWDYEKSGPFISQNEFVKLTTGEDDIFNIVYPEVECVNNVVLDCNPDALKNGYYKYDYTVATVEGFEYSIVTVKVPEDMDMYIATDNGIIAYTYVYIDEELKLEDKERYKNQVIHIGDVKKDQIITLVITHDLLTNGLANTLSFQFAGFNQEAFEKAYEKLSKSVYDIDVMNDNYVKGSINADKDGLMMTSIPAMDGFSVMVDGKKTDCKKVGAFIAVPLSIGEHDVEFKYITPYFKEGAIISLAGMLVYVLLCVMTFVKGKEDNKKAA
ncbi:MAG: hypothetical protein E7271_01715 [Lachnospiraceae bacterium]|jgi:uncharacterized membrane protein YfhO|nr:hypothetical protein [Lachnospiraceae bacterium]